MPSVPCCATLLFFNPEREKIISKVWFNASQCFLMTAGGRLATATSMKTAERKALIACDITAAGRAAVRSITEGIFSKERNVARKAMSAILIATRTESLLLDSCPAMAPRKKNTMPNIAGINAVLCDDPVRTKPATPKQVYAYPKRKMTLGCIFGLKSFSFSFFSSQF
jgi:hypothetical protein